MPDKSSPYRQDFLIESGFRRFNHLLLRIVSQSVGEVVGLIGDISSIVHTGSVKMPSRQIKIQPDRAATCDLNFPPFLPRAIPL